MTAKAGTIEQLGAEVRERLRLANGDNVTDEAVSGIARDVVEEYQHRSHRDGTPLLARPAAIVDRIVEDITGWGPLTNLVRDADIEEILVEGSNIFVMDNTSSRPTQVNVHATEGELLQAIIRMLRGSNRKLDYENPQAKASVLNGEARLTVTIPPASSRLSATIRRYIRRFQSLRSLVDVGTMSVEAAGFLWALMQDRTSRFVVSGIPGAGKTTLLAAMHSAAPPHHTIRILEQVTELDLGRALTSNYQEVDGGHRVGKELNLRHLIRHALSMRPDRIVVGEVLGEESAELFRAANTGAGFAVSNHAYSARAALDALVTTAIHAGENISIEAATRAFADAIDHVIHLAMDHRGGESRRRVMEILGVAPGEGGFSTTTIFARGSFDEPLLWTGARPMDDKAALIDFSLPEGMSLLGILDGSIRPTLP
ncbi:MAG: hypothetical protein GEU79_09205 [Acidimicrobiia bacterium]|nr:hypothetical protein [Acidimicrobiia bacterium]